MARQIGDGGVEIREKSVVEILRRFFFSQSNYANTHGREEVCKDSEIVRVAF